MIFSEDEITKILASLPSPFTETIVRERYGLGTAIKTISEIARDHNIKNTKIRYFLKQLNKHIEKYFKAEEKEHWEKYYKNNPRFLPYYKYYRGSDDPKRPFWMLANGKYKRLVVAYHRELDEIFEGLTLGEIADIPPEKLAKYTTHQGVLAVKKFLESFGIPYLLPKPQIPSIRRVFAEEIIDNWQRAFAE